MRFWFEPVINVITARARDRQWFSVLSGLLRAKSLWERDAAKALLRGSGIEIGALHNPLRLDPAVAQVRYVDRAPRSALIETYREIPAEMIVEVDVVADADALPFADGEVAFVIANHVLEHLEDPIGALKNWLRVLQPGGVLFLALPLSFATFDRARQRTPLWHMLRDHWQGVTTSRLDHYLEWTSCVRGIRGELESGLAANQIMGQRYPIHFHVWSAAQFLLQLLLLRFIFGLKFSITHVLRPALDADEFAMVLRKR